ncbi:KEOPS complex subunit Cgi121 [uncultured Methanobrevibacter sp.]|uniref:KEOPS complex subunit Cgi121 n=1 Tax=uncultured Methanobrevibacter sp. TaxID=253161 RepID=UPI0025FAB9CE|nr:KEOPS complex subunit Cgi121 [uncultured Methanobrevibacter sp.]
MENIKILGFTATIDSVGKTLSEIDAIKKDGEIIQLLNADAVASKNHIIHGVNQAFLAFERGENLAKDISVEIVLRCSAQRQISKAFKILGLSEGEMNLCAVLINCDDYSDELNSLFISDDDVLIANEEKLKEIYKISDFELENMSIEDLLIDRITKLTVDY